MYATYFGLSENPFNMTPDQKYLFLSHHHNDALDHLLYGIHERKGFIVISGGIGTGKTTLCRALLNQLAPSTKTALVFNTSISDLELLQTINEEFGIPTPSRDLSKKTLLDDLNHFLIDNHQQFGNAVLIVDEAHHLSVESLEQLRMLSNLETEREKLIQVVLLGQPELMALLRSPSLAQLNERITVRYELKPLDRREVAAYIEHRLLVAGGHGTVLFNERATSMVFSHSNGNPRRINAICDRALLIAYCKDTFTITKETVRQAVDDIEGTFNMATGSRQRWSQKKLAQTVAVVMMVFILANVAGWDVKNTMSSLYDAAEKTTAVQAKAFFGRPEINHDSRSMETAPMVRKSIVDTFDLSEFAMDGRASMAFLFRLFDVAKEDSVQQNSDIYPGLYAFKGDPQLYRNFVRPFRISVRLQKGDPPLYVVIKEVTPDGVICIDKSGTERFLTETNLLTHWKGQMSWIYPYESVSGKLTEGMSGLAVLRTQQMLQRLGYDVEPRGVFDRSTFEEVMRFQLNQGLRADGVVDTATKALLYQMTG